MTNEERARFQILNMFGKDVDFNIPEYKAYLRDMIDMQIEAEKEVFDDIIKECPSSIWDILNKEVIIPLKKRHLSTLEKPKEHN